MIIVTGGAGFIGSNLIRSLNAEGKEDIVIVEDIESFDFDDKWKNLVGLNYKEIISHRQRQALEFFIKQADTVIHLGAITSTESSDQLALFNNNYDFSKLLFSLSYTSNCHFIYASSAATYGTDLLHQEAFCDDLVYLRTLKPKNPYAFWKHRFDTWLHVEKAFEKGPERRLRPKGMGFTTGLKFFNVYGPGEEHKGRAASMVYHWLKEAKFNILPAKIFKPRLYESSKTGLAHGEQKRDFIYIEDVVQVLKYFISHPEPESCGVFNVGSGVARSFNELVSIVANVLEIKKYEREYIKMPIALEKQYQNYTCAGMEKFESVIGQRFIPLTLEEGVRKYAEYLEKGGF